MTAAVIVLLSSIVASAQQTLPSAPEPTKTSTSTETKKTKDAPPEPGSCRYVWIDSPAEASFRPLTSQQKFKLAICDFVHPTTYIFAAADAGISTAINPSSPYGPGMRGVSKRFGVDMTDELSDEFFSVYLIPSVFHEDPHFHPLGQGHPAHTRVLYAMSRVLLARKDNGRGDCFNTAEFLGTAITATLSNTYHPGRSQGVGNTSARVAISIASDAGYNIWKEYEPQVERKLQLRFAVVRRLVSRINIGER